MNLDRLTWRDLEQVPRERVVVFPLGSCEQHSVHLPFGADNIILTALMARLEELAGDRMVALPMLPYAHSHRHNAYPGALSVPIDLYISMVAAISDDMANAGFTKLLLLNAQYGNEAPVEIALRRIRERRPGFSAVGLSYWATLDEPVSDEFPGHAGELESSLLMHLAPELVRPELAARDGVGRPSKFAHKTVEYVRMDQRSHQGGFGDPESASAETGARLFEEIADRLAAVVRDLHDGLLSG